MRRDTNRQPITVNHRVKQLNYERKRLIKLLVDGVPSAKIAELLGKSQRSIYRNAETLCKNGFIRKEKVGNQVFYHITDMGFSCSSKPSTDSRTVSETVNSNRQLLSSSPRVSDVKSDAVRLHALRFEVPILRKPFDWESKRVRFVNENFPDAKPQRLKNQPDYFVFGFMGLTVRSLPDSFEVVVGEVFDHDAGRGVDRAYRVVRGVLGRLENVFCVSLEKPRKVGIELSYAHFGIVRNAFAEWFLERGVDMEIFDLDGVKRCWVDKSPDGEGVIWREIEFGREDDAGRMQKLIEDVTVRKVDLARASQKADDAFEGVKELSPVLGKVYGQGLGTQDAIARVLKNQDLLFEAHKTQFKFWNQAFGLEDPKVKRKGKQAKLKSFVVPDYVG